MTDKRKDDTAAAFIILMLVFTTSIVSGVALIHWNQTGEIWTTIGGCLVGWPILFIVLINIFGSNE